MGLAYKINKAILKKPLFKIIELLSRVSKRPDRVQIIDAVFLDVGLGSFSPKNACNQSRNKPRASTTLSSWLHQLDRKLLYTIY